MKRSVRLFLMASIMLATLMVYGLCASFAANQPPTSVKADASVAGSIVVTWDAPDDNTSYRFRIYRSTSASGTFTYIGATEDVAPAYIDNGINAGTTYYYKVTTIGGGDAESEKSAASNGATAKAEEQNDPGSGSGSGSSGSGTNEGGSSSGSGSASGGSSGDTITPLKDSKVTNVAIKSTFPMLANVTFTLNGGTYKQNGATMSCWDASAIVYVNGKKVKEIGNTGYSSFNVSIPYAGKSKVKIVTYQTLDGKKYAGASKTVSVGSKKLKKVSGVKATKISGKQASLRWNPVEGATSYRILKGKKKVKEVRKTLVRVSANGAGSAKYKVVALVKDGKKKYSGKASKAVKPVKNVRKFNGSIYYKDYSYATCRFIVKKISLNGKTYTITGYAVNNRIFKMKKYQSLSVSITADGKLVASKKFKNKKVGVAPERSKKIVLKIKGKPGADLANGNVYYSSNTEPLW